MSSFNDKIGEAFDLAYQLSVLLDDGVLTTLTVDSETADMIWGHADGLTAKWLYDRRDGRCSLNASINFDPAAEEARLDGQITTMRKLLETKP